MTISTDPTLCGRAAYASMVEQNVVPTPDNFAIWYEYHSGFTPQLNHLIELLLLKRQRFDEQLLASIHRRFFAHSRDREALQETSVRMLNLLQEVVGVVENAGADARAGGTALRATTDAMMSMTVGLPDLITRLRDEARDMAERTDRLGQNLCGAAERIQLLERSLQEVRRDAATDGLTGLHNRRAFDAKLREAAGQAMNSGEPLSLAFFDIDHFKRFNDSWGHQVGDEVLRLVATTVTAQIRPSDIAARYGGEEFGIILPATQTAEAALLANRIRGSFEDKRLIVRTTGKKIDGLSVSVGIACYDPGEALNAWIGRADKAMYSVKAGGRNRVEIAYS